MGWHLPYKPTYKSGFQGEAVYMKNLLILSLLCDDEINEQHILRAPAPAL